MDQFEKSHAVEKNSFDLEPPAFNRPAAVEICWRVRNLFLSEPSKTEVEMIQEKAEGRVGVASRDVIQFGFLRTPGGQSLPTFEQLAMPLFDSLYNFARWLTLD